MRLKIEPFLIKYFYSKMLQMKSGFVKGETYYVKIKDDTVDLIFDHYSDSTRLWNTGLWFHDISGRRCYLN